MESLAHRHFQSRERRHSIGAVGYPADSLGGHRHFAMQLENEAHDLERIAKAFRLISKEISYRRLANALLGVAIENSGAVRGTVLLSEGGERLARPTPAFHRKRRRSSPRIRPTVNFACPPTRVWVARNRVNMPPGGQGIAPEGGWFEKPEEKSAA